MNRRHFLGLLAALPFVRKLALERDAVETRYDWNALPRTQSQDIADAIRRAYASVYPVRGLVGARVGGEA